MPNNHFLNMRKLNKCKFKNYKHAAENEFNANWKKRFYILCMHNIYYTNYENNILFKIYISCCITRSNLFLEEIEEKTLFVRNYKSEKCRIFGKIDINYNYQYYHSLFLISYLGLGVI